MRTLLALLAALTLTGFIFWIGCMDHSSPTNSREVSIVLDSMPPSCPPHRPYKIMPLGDWLTSGSQPLGGGYRIRLWQDFQSAGQRVDFVGSQTFGPPELGDRQNEGHAWSTISDLAIQAKKERWIEEFQPDIVLLLIGSNDIDWGQDINDAPMQLAMLVDHILTACVDCRVILGTIPPIFPVPPRNVAADVKVYNATMPSIVAARPRVTLADINAALAPADIIMGDNGFYPTTNGYNKIADTWFAAILALP